MGVESVSERGRRLIDEYDVRRYATTTGVLSDSDISGHEGGYTAFVEKLTALSDTDQAEIVLSYLDRASRGHVVTEYVDRSPLFAFLKKYDTCGCLLPDLSPGANDGRISRQEIGATGEAYSNFIADMSALPVAFRGAVLGRLERRSVGEYLHFKHRDFIDKWDCGTWWRFAGNGDISDEEILAAGGFETFRQELGAIDQADRAAMRRHFDWGNAALGIFKELDAMPSVDPDVSPDAPGSSESGSVVASS